MHGPNETYVAGGPAALRVDPGTSEGPLCPRTCPRPRKPLLRNRPGVAVAAAGARATIATATGPRVCSICNGLRRCRFMSSAYTRFDSSANVPNSRLHRQYSGSGTQNANPNSICPLFERFSIRVDQNNCTFFLCPQWVHQIKFPK